MYFHFRHSFVFLILFSLCICVGSSSCSRTYIDFYPYSDTGEKKPTCVILPVYISPSLAKLPSMTSAMDILYSNIYQEVKEKGKIYMPDQGVLHARLQEAQWTVDSKIPVWEPSFVPWQALRPFEYIVALEIIRCNVEPYIRGRITPIYNHNNIAEGKSVLVSYSMRIAVFQVHQNNIVHLLRLETYTGNQIASKYEVVSDDPLYGFQQIGTPQYAILSRMKQDVTKYIEASIFQNRHL